MSSLLEQIASHPFFTTDVSTLPFEECIVLAYQRAILILRTYSMALTTFLSCTLISPKFWSLTFHHSHRACQFGSLARYLSTSPDLVPLATPSGIHLLSERSHGLDPLNIETTAHRQEDGSYVLHTTREEATKIMSASSPTFGVNKAGVGEDRGRRPFVPICNARELFPGVMSIRLPLRSGASPLDFSMTRFYKDLNSARWDMICQWRIPIGSFVVAGPCVSGLKHTAYIGGTYSLRRKVAPHGKEISLFTFPIQQ
ncbi:hypothetical protein BGW80DRAFT_1436731 [Lactifluus volemus]|nr:hypothetical protein BGW80DRAFT_1436731 [Lactifluus volemus]